jgi:hypothetical protein
VSESILFEDGVTYSDWLVLMIEELHNYLRCGVLAVTLRYKTCLNQYLICIFEHAKRDIFMAYTMSQNQIFTASKIVIWLE